MTQQRGVAAALLVLLLVAASTVSADQPAELELVFQGSHRVLLGVNRTCYSLCKAGKLRATTPAAPAAAPAPAASTASSVTSSTTAPPPAAATTTSTSPRPGPTTVSTAAAAPTTTGTPAASTASRPAASNATQLVCPGGLITQAELADLLQRRQKVKLALMSSDFFEIFWSGGNLYSAWADLMKQALASAQSGEIVVDASSVLQFNMNIASITAYWGYAVSNILQLTADGLYPVDS